MKSSAEPAKPVQIRLVEHAALPPRVPLPAPPRFESISLEPYRRARSTRAPSECAAEAAAIGDEALVVRADTAPIACADVIVERALQGKTSAANEAEHAMVGLAIAAKLARTAEAPPRLEPTSDKAKIKAFIGGPLRSWMIDQATAIEELSRAARELAGYGRGVAAIEAGTADLRLVDTIRSAPVPKSWDADLVHVYEAALDEALEPRKARGRDAALVGLADLAAVGVVESPRATRARAILSKLYGGRRIDALDALLLPPLKGPRPVSPFLVARAPKTARDWLDAGRMSWQRPLFIEAAHAFARSQTPEDRLGLAVSLALSAGPASAADMMGAASPSELNLIHTEALDALADEGGPLSGMAAFDAAHLRSLSPPESGTAAYFAEVAARFRRAESLLTDPAAKARAHDRAAEAATLSDKAAH
jgi:hypothetical protein